MKNQLGKVESKLRAFIEGGAARLLPVSKLSRRILEHLTAAMTTGSQDAAGRGRVAPDIYTVSVHPAHRQDLEHDPAWTASMQHALEEAAHQAGLSFLAPPVIQLVEDTNALPHQVRVQAGYAGHTLDDTSDLVVNAAAPPRLPENAFLIIDGTRIHPLQQAVINIGRKSDNDICIEDARVSRNHAQLRASNGFYTIFDLDSAGGTYINDQPVRQSVLYPGDVISLAGVPLVYGQEDQFPGNTQKLSFKPGA